MDNGSGPSARKPIVHRRLAGDFWQVAAIHFIGADVFDQEIHPPAAFAASRADEFVPFHAPNCAFYRVERAMEAIHA